MKKIPFVFGLAVIGFLGLFLIVAVLSVSSQEDGQTFTNRIAQIFERGNDNPEQEEVPIRNAEERGLPSPAPYYSTDALAYGGPPNGGYTMGWTIPEAYANGATRTILLPFVYHHYLQNYAIDISTTNVSNNFIPTYSSLNGTVIQVDKADPTSHVYGNFVRIRNAKPVCVNNEIVYRDCRQGSGNLLFGVSDPSISWGGPPAAGSTDADRTGWIEDPNDPSGWCKPTLVWASQEHCMQGESAASFSNNRLPDLGHGKSANYEVVIGHLTEGRIPSEVSVGSTIDNEQLLGNMGTSGVNPSTGEGNTLTPMVHYEVWEAQGCPQTTFVPVDPVQFFNQEYSGHAEGPPSPCCPDPPSIPPVGSEICDADGDGNPDDGSFVHFGFVDGNWSIEYACLSDLNIVIYDAARKKVFDQAFGGNMNDPGCSGKNYGPGMGGYHSLGGNGPYVIDVMANGTKCGHYGATLSNDEIDPADLTAEIQEWRDNYARLCQYVSGLDASPGRQFVSLYGYDGNPFATIAEDAFDGELDQLTCTQSGWSQFLSPGTGEGDEWKCSGDVVQHDCEGFGAHSCTKDTVYYNSSLGGENYTFSTEFRFTETGGKLGLFFRGKAQPNPDDRWGDAWGYYYTVGSGSDVASFMQLQTTNDDPVVASQETSACLLYDEAQQLGVECASSADRCPNQNPDDVSLGDCCASCGNLTDINNPWNKLGDIPLPADVEAGTWHTLAVKVVGETAVFYFDDLTQPVGVGTVDTFTKGIVGLKTYEAKAEFRNMRMQMLDANGGPVASE